jgi:putative glycosyltransferase (TIGR04348 family)
MSSKPRVCIVTPAFADANNGNWQTARRWAHWLAADYRVRVVGQWRGEPADALIALHARRSAASIEDWSRQLVRPPLVVALTGTDLYQDIASDAAAQRSLALADRLVVLNELGRQALPARHRAKAIVCLQSCSAWQPRPKTARRLRALMVGHLRAVKDPSTFFAAARLLAEREDIVLDHVGAALEPDLGAQARALMRAQPRYRWLGPLPHRVARARIQRAHVLVHPSRLEGGAHVVMEAVRSGTPVIASRIDGNLGLLGSDYAGCFDPGDAAGLAALLERARDDPAMLPRLKSQCDARASLFDPARERATLRRLLQELLETSR